MLSFIIANQPLPYRCQGALAYRLAAPKADHYSLINDGPAKTVRLTATQQRYASGLDVLTNKPININQPIVLDGHSGRWLRLIK